MKNLFPGVAVVAGAELEPEKSALRSIDQALIKAGIAKAGSNSRDP